MSAPDFKARDHQSVSVARWRLERLERIEEAARRLFDDRAPLTYDDPALPPLMRVLFESLGPEKSEEATE